MIVATPTTLPNIGRRGDLVVTLNYCCRMEANNKTLACYTRQLRDVCDFGGREQRHESVEQNKIDDILRAVRKRKNLRDNIKGK